MSNRRVAEQLGIPSFFIELESGPSSKQWRYTASSPYTSVEPAILTYFEADGWKGYCGEGGLILNLIKAMSFPDLTLERRATFVESLYTYDHRFFESDMLTVKKRSSSDIDLLLENVASATIEQIVRNFSKMISNAPCSYELQGMTFTDGGETSMLSFFPDLELWMFTELYDALGTRTILNIATIFATDPYAFRRGWPDLTIWKNNNVRFVEVKAPRDKLGGSQKLIIEKILRPLDLDVSVVDVLPRKA